MRDFLARVGSLRILYRYPCPHSTKLYFVCQTICRLLVITHEMIFKISRFKIIYFFMDFINVLLNMCLVENLKVYRLILERSLLMVLFLSLSFLNILSMSNLDCFSIFLEAVKISSYLLASLLTKTRNLYANIEILFLLHA